MYSSEANASDFPQSLSACVKWEQTKKPAGQGGDFVRSRMGQRKAEDCKTPVGRKPSPEIRDVDGYEARLAHSTQERWNGVIQDGRSRSQLSDVSDRASIPPSDGGLEAVAQK